MCYDISYLSKKSEQYSKRFSRDENHQHMLKKAFDDLKNEIPATYHVSGFANPEVPVFTDQDFSKPILLEWGLIPSWIKSSEDAENIRKKTLNARIEEITKKNSYKKAVQSGRCAIVVDGFFEHHYENNKPRPYFIKRKDEQPFLIAGIWEESYLEGNHYKTLSLVTSKANSLMAKIHNNPKLSEPRMPAIMEIEIAKEWMQQDDLSQEDLLKILSPIDDMDLTAYEVPAIKGKSYVGNSKVATQPINRPKQSSLF